MKKEKIEYLISIFEKIEIQLKTGQVNYICSAYHSISGDRPDRRDYDFHYIIAPYTADPYWVASRFDPFRTVKIDGVVHSLYDVTDYSYRAHNFHTLKAMVVRRIIDDLKIKLNEQTGNITEG